VIAVFCAFDSELDDNVKAGAVTVTVVVVVVVATAVEVHAGIVRSNVVECGVTF
jgi:hypothetical protein